MQPTNSMKIDHDDVTTLDENLFKEIGLYQLLKPSFMSGKKNRYRICLLFCLWLTLVTICMQLVRLHLDRNDLPMFQFELLITVNIMISVFKGHVVVMNADKIWEILEAARYGFTSCGHPSSFHRCEYSLRIWLHTFTILVVGTTIVWLLAPLFKHEYIELAKLDGTVGNYRVSVFNFWYPVTTAMYNWPPIWAMIYMYESFMHSVQVTFLLFFDLFFISMCIILVSQFETLSASYETLDLQNHRVRLSSQSLARKIQKDHLQLGYYNNLILLINDNEKIMKKYDEFFDIIKPVFLIQVIVSSISIILILLSILLSIRSGVSIISPQILKNITTYVFFTVQLYIYCNFLNILETAKSTLNFGLYSSNWTEMDLKFKKTMLLAMIINSAHKRVIKASPEIIINLELFVRVMKISYTVVSVLLNLSTENTTVV